MLREIYTYIFLAWSKCHQIFYPYNNNNTILEQRKYDQIEKSATDNSKYSWYIFTIFFKTYFFVLSSCLLVV